MVPSSCSLAILALAAVHIGGHTTTQPDCVVLQSAEAEAEARSGSQVVDVSPLAARGAARDGRLQKNVCGPQRQAAPVVMLQALAKPMEAVETLPTKKLALLAHAVKDIALCPGLNQASMVAFMVVVGVAFLLLTGLQPTSYGKAESACVVQLMVLLIVNLTFTVMIPTSYLVSRVAGHGAAYSGFLIGVHQAGVCLGSVVMWLALQKYPNIWKSAYSILLAATTFNVVGAAMYFAISVVAEPMANEELLGKSIEPMPWMTGPLIMSRIMDGCGTGISVQLGQMLIVHLIPSEQRPGWMATNQFASMLGIGFGPMIGSMISFLNICHVPTQHLLAVSIGYLGLALSAFTLAATRFPSNLADAQDFQPPDESKALPTPLNAAAKSHLLQANLEEQSRDLNSRTMVVVGALLMAFIRGFVISGLEASASLLLEVKYHWGTNMIGIAIGMCFLFCTPVKIFYNAYEAQLSILNWIRTMGFGAMIGGLLLYKWKDDPAMAYVLLSGDALLFPTLFLGDALSAGLLMMSQHQLPKGSIFDANTIVLLRVVIVCTGRNIGPPIARMAVEMHGQNGYANQQMFLAVAFLIIFEMLVARNAKCD